MQSGRLAALSPLLLVGAVLVSQGAPATAAGSVSFTAAQASRGAIAFHQNCASCHGANLQGVSAPALSGKTSALAQQSVAEMYVYEAEQMPMTAPASLSSKQYVDIAAYILEQNGHKPGALPLTVAAVKASDAVVGAH